MYRADTDGIRVIVSPAFVPERSDPQQAVYFWAYTVDIINLTPDPVQLLARHWIITDGEGRVEEVRGPGVVGEQPVIPPGQTYRYTSGCPLPTPEGSMQGSYEMTDAQGRAFVVAIPVFALISPFVRRTLH
jgi:ApaG protein